MNKFILASVFCLLFLSSQSQNSSRFWRFHEENEITNRSGRLIIPQKYKTVRLDFEVYADSLLKTPMEQSGIRKEWFIPMPDGTFQRFRISEVPVMAPELAAKFPEIHTYAGQGVDDPMATIRLDITPKGTHIMILSPKGSVFVDPYSNYTAEEYISYYKHDFSSAKSDLGAICYLPERIKGESSEEVPATESTGEFLRKYRLAVAATGEYTAFHGGTVPGAMAAIVTSVNRVSGIYEREFAIRLELVANNDLLIYTNPSTDPYTNNDGGVMLGQNQTTLNAVIGTANYDMGHVFSTGGGGIAGFGVVCSNSKAEGVTGSPAPVGDPFDVDYVAHEMGHQFGANHSFNGNAGSCGGGNRNGPTAYEPGSGSTIMAYAGLCGNHDIQSNSDDYFHGVSYDEIINYTVNGLGNNCPVITSTGNQAPLVSVGSSGFYIPVQTPFELTASGSDPDNDPITYCWEEFDLGPGGAPNTPIGTAPLFRSFNPVTDSTRVFPRLSAIVANQTSDGEILPTTSRSLTFRATVRDNKIGSGGVNFDEIFFQSTSQAGPFVVTEPNIPIVWIAGTIREVKWNVANTDKLPVNCQKVDIYLSSDGGFTYPTLLAANVLNTGTASVVVPNTPGNANRVKVKAADNVFFDISNQNFSIQTPSAPGFDFYLPQQTASICAPYSFSVDVVLTSLLNFAGNVNLSVANLPAGLTAAFSSNPVQAPDTVQIVFTATSSVVSQTANMVIKGTGPAGETDSIAFALLVQNQTPSAVSTALPQTGATNQILTPMFLWAPTGGTVTYEIQVATKPDFAPASVVLTQNGLTTNQFTPPISLNPFTVYYWRVRSENICGVGQYSPVAAFQTKAFPCQVFNAGNLPLNIPAFGAPLTVQSVIIVPANLSLADVNVTNLDITHSWVNDLDVVLQGPGNITATLFSRICDENDEDFDLNLDDEAASGDFPCPPVGGGTYRPEDSLTVFDGINSAGIWTLKVTDNENFDGGTLNSWSLELCEASDNIRKPSLIKNNLLSLLQWKHETITTQLLEATDSVSGPDDLTFTLMTLPENGFVQLDSISLPLGGTFTQQDINSGKVRYQHNGTTTTSDNFVFTITNADGGWLGSPVFSVVITNTTAISDFNDKINVLAYPNPASQNVNVRISGNSTDPISIELLDIQGRIIATENLRFLSGEAKIRFSAAGLTNGLYLIRVIAAEQSLIQKVTIQK
ncbi:MAG: M12 family metallo-peptidase [Bacteroidia bacterium]|nr:M12 family metallo-peptidase [Bacteroidia bacterium]